MCTSLETVETKLTDVVTQSRSQSSRRPRIPDALRAQVIKVRRNFYLEHGREGLMHWRHVKDASCPMSWQTSERGREGRARERERERESEREREKKE